MILLFSIVWSGCSAKKTPSVEVKPPYYGGFLKDNGDLIEVPEMELFGYPGTGEMTGVPSISNTQPIFVLWKPDTRLDYLDLYSVDMQERINYHAVPKDDGILELQPAEFLPPGYYCYIQGDPLQAFLPGWCFQVSSTGSSNSESTSYRVISPANIQFLAPVKTRNGKIFPGKGIEGIDLISSMAWYPANNEIRLTDGEYIYIYNLSTMMRTAKLPCEYDGEDRRCQGFSADGRYIVMDGQNPIYIIDIDTWQAVNEIWPLTDIDFEYLSNGQIFFQTRVTGDPELHYFNGITGEQISDDPFSVCSPRIYDKLMTGGARANKYSTYRGSGISLERDETYIRICDVDHQITFPEVVFPKRLFLWTYNPAPDGNTFYIVGLDWGNDQTPYLIEINIQSGSSRVIQEYQWRDIYDWGDWNYAISPDGKILAGQYDGEFGFIDTSNGQLLYRIPVNYYAQDILFSPDGRFIFINKGNVSQLWAIGNP
jgi:hypothetical protein